MQTVTQSEVLRDMGDGIIIRRVRDSDREALAAFHTEIFSARAAADVQSVCDDFWRVGDRDHFLVAEDTKTGALVSSLSLLSRMAYYEDIAFPVGIPEWVLSRAEYRNKGLVRAQFDIIHQWSAERGDLMQLIGGIPFYYRQYGYDLALEMTNVRIGFKSYMPKLKDGESEPYLFREATAEDVPFIVETIAATRSRYLMSVESDAHYWEGLVARAQTDDPWRHPIMIIETPEGERVGMVQYQGWLNGDHQVIIEQYEVAPGRSWLPVTQSLIRHICAKGKEYEAATPGKEFGTFAFYLPANHPAYEVIDDLLPRRFDGYAWYVRIPDLLRFIQHITPVLERRLAASPLVGHTGELRLSFYRSGLRLAFEAGKLTAVEPWMPDPSNEGHAGFPNLIFSQLLLGYRSLEELEHAYRDCWHDSDTSRALLRALFPKGTSFFWF